MKREIGLLNLAAVLSMVNIAAAEESRTMLILDGSGSMWGRIDGRSKIEIARDAVDDILSDIPDESPLGLMAYGHRREGDCTDIEVLVPPARGTSEEISGRIKEIVPRGKTPIGQALLRAAEALEYRSRAATVVLVSDGIETCDVDLCQLAATLEADGLDFASHVIGFDLDVEERATLECLASETGGRFVAAGNADQLAEALRETVLVAADEDSSELSSADRVEEIVVDGSDVIFLAGRDDVVIPPRGTEHDSGFVIKRHAYLEEPLLETFPPHLSVQPGNVVQVLDLARGGIHFFPEPNSPGWGPAGDPGGSTAVIEPLAGISGYKGPRGALLGVFLGQQNRVDAEPPPTLGFEASAPGADYTQLAPELGQVFFIGDGASSSTGALKKIVAPDGAVRLYLGIADGWLFSGAPGYYDDNDGRYTLRIAIDGAEEPREEK